MFKIPLKSNSQKESDDIQDIRDNHDSEYIKKFQDDFLKFTQIEIKIPDNLHMIDKSNSYSNSKSPIMNDYEINNT